MTVLRREDVQSIGASWDVCPCRIAGPPVLTIVPLIIRRLRRPFLTGRHLGSVDARAPTRPLSAGARLQGGPDKARQFARDGDRRSWASACVRVTSLRKRRHKRCCALSAMAITRAGWPLAASREGGAQPGRC